MKVSSGFPRTTFISVVIFSFALAPRLFAMAKIEDLEIVFSGDVADYPDYRRRAKGVYAGAETDLKELVAPVLWRKLKGDAWQLVKDWDPETLRGSNGFDRL